MASTPCDRHGSIQRGALCTAYPALIKDGKRLETKRKLCRDCMRELLLAHATDWVDYVFKSEVDERTACTRCGEMVAGNGGLTRFFCTAYLDGKTRRDYFALYCPGCTDETVREFDLHAA